MGQIPQIAVITTECEYALTLICSSSCDQTGASERFERIEHFVPLVLGLHPNGNPSLRAEVASAKQTVLWASEGLRKGSMKLRRIAGRRLEEGKVGWIFLWLLGVPIPVLLIIFLLRGCT